MKLARIHSLAIVVLALFTNGAASACSLARDYQRPAVSAQYDEAYDAWLAELSERMRGDPDPEIAYAGWLLDGAALDSKGPPPPPPETDSPPSVAPPAQVPAPTTRFARFMRYAYCRRSQRCDDDIAAWAAADSGNLFPLERAVANFQRGKIPGIERLIAEATRFDDYPVARRALAAKIAARQDLAPPPTPPGYVLPPCRQSDDLSPEGELLSRLSESAVTNFDGLAHAGDIAEDVRLHAADLMVAATGTAYAAERGVRVGVSAARSVPDRERYCRLQARVAALNVALSRRMFDRDGMKAYGPRLDAALATRNGIDAAEVIASEIGEVPPPLDEEKIAVCVASNGDELNR